MGIKFTCPTCGRTLNVKSELAGKRGRCPKCQAKIAIPEADAAGAGEEAAGPAVSSQTPSDVGGAPPTAGASAASPEQEQPAAAAPSAATSGASDPIGEAPNMQWYAVPPGATSQYGPASGDELRAWLAEGRIAADALVWRQDWADWKRAGDVFTQLETPPVLGAPTAAPLAAPGGVPLPTAVAAMPGAAGGPPVAQAIAPLVGIAPAMVPTAMPAAGWFPIAADDSRVARVSGGRAYRTRSNRGPMIAICALLFAMIPLSYFVYKVISEQLLSSPAASSATGSKHAKE